VYSLIAIGIAAAHEDGLSEGRLGDRLSFTSGATARPVMRHRGCDGSALQGTLAARLRPCGHAACKHEPLVAHRAALHHAELPASRRIDLDGSPQAPSTCCEREGEAYVLT